MRLHRLGWAAAVAFVLIIVPLYALALIAPAAGMYHDDGIYLVTAKSLAEGHGYKIISLPGEPPQTKYPVLFPFLLSLVWRVYPKFPANLPLLRLVPLGSTVAWMVLAAEVLRMLGASRRERALILLLTVGSPWVAFLATTTLSESLFAALLTAGLLLLIRTTEPAGTATGFWAGVAFGAALLTRAAGAVPAAAGLVVLAWSKRWSATVAYGLGFGLVAIPWFVWVLGQNSSSAAIDTYYSALPYGSWNIVSSYAPSEKLEVLVTNVIYSCLAIGQIWGWAWPGLMAPLIAAPLAMLVVAGLWRSRAEPAVAVIGAYIAMVLMWVWPPLRFLLPVTPLLIWYGIVGARRTRTAYALLAVLLATSAYKVVILTAQVSRTGVAWPVQNVPDDWNSMVKVFAWVNDNTSPNAVLSGNLDPTYFLFTNRKALRAFETDPYRLYYNVLGRPGDPVGTSETFRRRLLSTRSDYLILTPSKNFAQMAYVSHFAHELAASGDGSMTRVAAALDSGYEIYSVNRERLLPRVN